MGCQLSKALLYADLLNVFETFLPQLLLYPNPTDPLNGEAAALLMREPEAYNAKVKGETALLMCETLQLWALRPAQTTHQRMAKHAAHISVFIMQSMAVCQLHLASRSSHAAIILKLSLAFLLVVAVLAMCSSCSSLQASALRQCTDDDLLWTREFCTEGSAYGWF